MASSIARFRHHTTSTPHQKLKPVHLTAAEFDRDAVDGHLAVAGVEGDVPRRELDAECFAWPAQESAHTRDKLVDLERLAQIVVGALVEARHQILQAVARREHEDWPRHLAAALLAEPNQSILIRQTKIEKQRVVMSAGKRAFGVRRRADVVNGEAAVLQGCGEIVGEPLIVFDEQEAHRSPPISDHRRRPNHPRRQTGNAPECVARE